MPSAHLQRGAVEARHQRRATGVPPQNLLHQPRYVPQGARLATAAPRTALGPAARQAGSCWAQLLDLLGQREGEGARVQGQCGGRGVQGADRSQPALACARRTSSSLNYKDMLLRQVACKAR